jgi:hypothetical protein
VDRRALREQRMRRRRAATLASVVVLIVVTIVAYSLASGGSPSSSAPSTTTSTTASGVGGRAAKAASTDGRPVSLEAGVESWQLPVALSRTTVVANGRGFTVLGGLTTSQASVASVYAINPASGTIATNGTLPSAVHDAAVSHSGSRPT